jgi:predicted nucleic acid-binding protein
MKTALLDTSFLIDLDDEAESGVVGPATRTLATLREYRLFISPVTVAELLEGAEMPEEAAKELATYQKQTIGWQAAQRCALNQSRAPRRMGENDAWQAALAALSGHRLVGHDVAFEGRPGLDYLDHRKYV